MAFFGDKYNPDRVRVIDIPHFSVELCGGTHVHATGDIGTFKITEVTALSAGQRRIVAVTGPKAIELFQESFSIIKTIGQEFKVTKEQVLEIVFKQKQELKECLSHIKQLRKQITNLSIDQWLQTIEDIKKIPYLFLALVEVQPDELKDIAAQLESKKPGFYVITSVTQGKSFFFIHQSTQYADNINLQNFASWLKDNQGMRGGVSANSIQGGAAQFSSRLNEEIKTWITKEVS